LREFNFGAYHFNIVTGYTKHKPDVVKFLRTINSAMCTPNEVTHEQEHFSLRYRNLYFAWAPNLINKERKRLAIWTNMSAIRYRLMSDKFTAGQTTKREPEITLPLSQKNSTM